jgi:S1-C subfamily serine protease
MFPRAILPAVVLAFAHSVGIAQDAIPPETLANVKHATVFIQVSSASGKSSGTGFVVSVNKDTVLVATNHHVIGLQENEKKVRLLPSELSRSLKLVSINVVFDPGTKNETSMKAEPVAADPDTDLAVLRVTGVKSPPKPIAYTSTPKLTETMPVFTFGFPFGTALATGKGAPAITVGKGSISSLRLDDDGELSVVQIDGALNPGNSGGPVVDAKGQLVGVAVATIRNGQGIGLAIPGAELGKMMKGRLGSVHLASTGLGAKKTTRAEVEVVDPLSALNGVKLHYVFVAPNGAKPALDQALEKHAGAKSITLKATGDLATGELPIEPADGVLYVQAVPQGGLGTKGATPVRDFAMTAARGVSGASFGQGGQAIEIKVPAIGAKPPAGWKEQVPKDNTYVVWVPEKNAGQRGSERTLNSNGLRIKINAFNVDLGPGQRYIVEELVVPPGLTTNRRSELEVLVRDIIVDGSRGRLVDSFEVRMGPNRGREYRVQSGSNQIRARVFVVQNRLMVLQAEGSREFVENPSSGTFLDSCRLMVGGVPRPPMIGPAPAPAPGPNPFSGTSPMSPSPFNGGTPNPTIPGPKTIPAPTVGASRRSRIQGGGNDPEVIDEGPAGARLIGLEIGLGEFFGKPVIHAVRPIYRSGDADVLGAWRGPTAGKQIQKVIAKPGYSVGNIALKTGLGIDGLSLTFMRVVNDQLDPADSYTSPWIGGMGGGGPVQIGDGRVAVGIVTKARNDSVSGLGLLYPDPSAAVVPAPSTPPTTNAPEAPPRTPEVPSQPQQTPPSPEARDASEDSPPKKSNLPIILIAVGGVVFLLLGVGVLAFALTRGGKKSGGGRKSASRYEDDDDDERPRRRTRRR